MIITRHILTKFCLAFLFLGSAWQVHSQNFKAGTYNIRYDTYKDSLNPWMDRLPVVTQLIQFHDFDIFTGQEMLPLQLDSLLKRMPEYTFTGVAREDGKRKGEFSPIIFKKNRFTLKNGGTFWLSLTPDIPSLGWDSFLPRICTWGLFEDGLSKMQFYFFSVHFDGHPVARHGSTELILDSINQIAGHSPVILAGDFNFDENHECYRHILSANLEDAFTLSPILLATTGTTNNFDISSAIAKRIDHIFLSHHFSVNRYGILTDSYRGKFPSDHFPVLIEIERK